MSDFIGAIVAALIFGTIYSLVNREIVSRRKADKSNDFLYACWAVLGVFVTILAVTFWQTSITVGLVFVILTLVFGFSFLVKSKTGKAPAVKMSQPSDYPYTVLRNSTESARDIIKILAIDKQKNSDKLMFEMIAFSLFITSLHCQREKISKERCDGVIAELTDEIASRIADISNSNAPGEHKLLTSTMQHFYKNHVEQSSNSGDMLQTVAVSIMAEYRGGKSEDFVAMTEIVNTLSNLGKELNETGFVKSLA